MKYLLLGLMCTLPLWLNAQEGKNADTISTTYNMSASEKEMTVADNNDTNVKLRFDVRMDGIYNTYAQQADMPMNMSRSEYGFVGRYAKLVLFGNITDKLSYSFRYRINVPNSPSVQVFSSIDWMNLTYDIDDNFFVAGGKQMIYMGGWEYDVAPIDVHIGSLWWINTPLCFGFGVLGGWRSDNKKHSLYLQASNTHLEAEKFNKQFSYGLTWYGDMGIYKAIHSVNFLEYEPGKFINYIVLGNKFDFGDKYFYIDWMNRAGSTEKFFANYSIIAKYNQNITDKLSFFAKGGYDQNLSQNVFTPQNQVYDRIILPGTKYVYYGLGAEYTPVVAKKHAVRLHAFWCANNNDYSPQTFNVGVKWQMNVLE